MNPLFISAGVKAINALFQILLNHASGELSESDAQAQWDEAVASFKSGDEAWSKARGPGEV